MPLDPSKLRNVHRTTDGGFIAQCPACAGTGHDSTGNHLKVYADGKFGCVAFQGDSAHRREIYRLTGTPGSVKPVIRMTIINPRTKK